MDFAIARGVSMMPIIQNGDILVLKKKQFQRGDIIVYDGGNKIVTHRLIRKKQLYLVTKGDNVLFPDSPLDINNILGVIVFVIRNKGCGKNDIYRINDKANKKQLFISITETYITSVLAPLIKLKSFDSFLKKVFYFIHRIIYKKYY